MPQVAFPSCCLVSSSAPRRESAEPRPIEGEITLQGPCEALHHSALAALAPPSTALAARSVLPSMGFHALLQGIFLTQGLNPNLLCLLLWQTGSFPSSLKSLKGF